MSKGLDPALEENVEEEYSPDPVVGRVESRPQRCQNADETLHGHVAANLVHLDQQTATVWNERQRMKVLVKTRAGV
jgi:hypothetical protein